MKLNSVFAWTLIYSISVGFVVFMVIEPFVVQMLFGFELAWTHTLMGSMVMYLLYWPLQIVLSSIHLVLTRYWERSGTPPRSTILKAFFTAEWLLYILIYFALTWADGELDAWQFILIFSIPYIICCTISVYLYRNFYEKELKRLSDSAPEIQ